MKLFGLIGYPLGHSFSKQWFGDMFRREGLTDVSYDNFPLKDLSELPELLRSTSYLAGFNVTAPYKESVIQYLDCIDPVAEAIGAVNCVTRHKGILKGYNVDWKGFSRSLSEFVGGECPAALVLGSGGAAKAAAYALSELNTNYLFVSRNASDKARTISYDDLSPEIIANHPLIVNATPLGTFPDTDKLPPIPYDLLTPQHFLYDMVYNPAETAFMTRGISRGAAATNGLRMLNLQAEESWMLFQEVI